MAGLLTLWRFHCGTYCITPPIHSHPSAFLSTHHLSALLTIWQMLWLCGKVSCPTPVAKYDTEKVREIQLIILFRQQQRKYPLWAVSSSQCLQTTKCGTGRNGGYRKLKRIEWEVYVCVHFVMQIAKTFVVPCRGGSKIKLTQTKSLIFPEKLTELDLKHLVQNPLQVVFPLLRQLIQKPWGRHHFPLLAYQFSLVLQQLVTLLQDLKLLHWPAFSSLGLQLQGENTIRFRCIKCQSLWHQTSHCNSKTNLWFFPIIQELQLYRPNRPVPKWTALHGVHCRTYSRSIRSLCLLNERRQLKTYRDAS